MSGRCRACNKTMSNDEMCNINPILNLYEELCFVCLSIADPPSRRSMKNEIYHLVPETDIVDALADIFLDENEEFSLKIDEIGMNYE